MQVSSQEADFRGQLCKSISKLPIGALVLYTNTSRYLFLFSMQINKCQLTTRHWYITDGNGVKEEVHGEGVVGEYPVMTPGALHEYISCTTFTTPTGVMRGHYEFRFLNREGQCEVQIPPLIFKSLPYTKAEELSCQHETEEN